MSDYAVVEKTTIYIVDPDPEHCASVESLFGRLGFESRSYSSAEEFLESLATPAINGCVVSEMLLPGMSGLEMLSELRDRRAGLPVIILTADADVARAVEALHHKVSDYLVKPVVERELVRRIQNALRASESQRRIGTNI